MITSRPCRRRRGDRRRVGLAAPAAVELAGAAGAVAAARPPMPPVDIAPASTVASSTRLSSRIATSIRTAAASALRYASWSASTPVDASSTATSDDLPTWYWASVLSAVACDSTSRPSRYSAIVASERALRRGAIVDALPQDLDHRVDVEPRRDAAGLARLDRAPLLAARRQIGSGPPTDTCHIGGRSTPRTIRPDADGEVGATSALARQRHRAIAGGDRGPRRGELGAVGQRVGQRGGLVDRRRHRQLGERPRRRDRLVERVGAQAVERVQRLRLLGRERQPPLVEALRLEPGPQHVGLAALAGGVDQPRHLGGPRPQRRLAIEQRLALAHQPQPQVGALDVGDRGQPQPRDARAAPARPRSGPARCAAPRLPGHGSVCETPIDAKLPSIDPISIDVKPSFWSPSCSIGSGSAPAAAASASCARTSAAAAASSGRAARLSAISAASDRLGDGRDDGPSRRAKRARARAPAPRGAEHDRDHQRPARGAAAHHCTAISPAIMSIAQAKRIGPGLVGVSSTVTA